MKKILSTHMTVKGFTLVEMLVASAIFAGVVVIATGALYRAQFLNTKVQQTQIILDGANLSLEMMVREIRYGYNYHCSPDFSTTTPPVNFDLRRSCPLEIDVVSNPTAFAGKAIIFHPRDMASDIGRVAYYIETKGRNSRILKATCTNPDPGNPGRCLWDSKVEQITGDDTYIDSLSFFVTGANSSVADDGTNYSLLWDNFQPIITFVVGGRTRPDDGTNPVPFHLQFSTVSRVLDN